MFDGVDAESVWKERYEQQTLKYTSVIPSEYSARNSGLTLDNLCIVNEPEHLLDRHNTTRDKYFAAMLYSIFNCARPTGYYQCDYHDQPDYCDMATFGDIEFKKYGLLTHPVDVVNYLVAAAKIDRVLLTREPSDESYSNPHNIRFKNPVPECELSKCNFGVKPLNYSTYMNANELYQEVPPRYSSYLNKDNHCRLSDEDALILLMEKCDYYARDMYINVLWCGTIQWNWTEERVKSLMGHFFSKTFELELRCFSHDTATEGMLKHILEAILSSSNTQLAHLTISEAFDSHIDAIAPLLSNPHVPCRLEELYLDAINLSSVDSANALGDILSCQSNISSFEVWWSCGETTSSRFITSIIDLLQRPEFKHLSLINGTFSSEALKTLITTFLTTPCSHDQSVQLLVSLTDSPTDHGQKLDIPQSALEYKSLEASTHTGFTINPLLMSLYPLKLNSLCISGAHCTCVNPSILDLAAHHTSLYVNHLTLELTDFSTEHFQTLLQNASLKELQLVPNGPVGLCDITHGLVKIGEKGTLENLTVNSFTANSSYRIFGNVKASSIAEEEQFGETLFSLPHLNHFSLELSIEFDESSDMTDFFKTMYKSWERTSQRLRLKKFALNLFSRAGQLPPLDEKLQSIAEEIGMEVTIRKSYELVFF